MGTVGFSIHGVYKEAFKDEEIKEGELYFACGAGESCNWFEIQNYFDLKG